ncbi:arginine deiminase type-3 [Metarhizium robertsii ARSEF 23]|uniref:Arginine deiminase type-3 n=1 Tax=Metarhizium robertsii (strain ARSEF 23 / ATCC MYA-3075) TaxID=655844 RepID=E9F4K0_METRA|nr:arginine deiminase type-3 [Metarhizium robertsii ARSEF 23]EFY97182.1 arginine deiminase type-3 [Metarhizium robertsii ARSEF 23]
MGALAQAATFKADIRADSNRDGKVDTEGLSDLGKGKETGSEEVGALFLPNIGDTSDRCRELHEAQPAALVKCNDASDDIQRASKYLAPLRTVPISSLGSSAVGRISVSDPLARKCVRIFHRSAAPEFSQEQKDVFAIFSEEEPDNEWTIVDEKTTFSATELAQGLQLGIDARGPRGHLVAEIDDDGNSKTDKKTKTHFAGIEASAKKAGIEEPVQQTSAPNGFIQDLFETMQASIPGPEGTVISLPIILPAPMAHGLYHVPQAVARQIRSTGVGMVTDVQPQGSNEETLDAMGNLETIPPYEFNGKNFSAGRIVMGANQTAGRVPLSLPFLQAQEMQDPLLIDTTWLEVQHVDEFLQFLPAKTSQTSRKWCVMVSDPLATLEILRGAQAEGHGNDTYITRPAGNKYTFNTVDNILGDGSFAKTNEECARRIQGVLDVLKAETGITEDDIFRVPVLYDRPKLKFPSNGDFQVRAVYPNAINGLVLNDWLYVAPKQWAVVNATGTDVMQYAVEMAYGKAGYKVDFVDDWELHMRMGDIHCATNVFRELPGPMPA